MNANERDEITASVAAHADLGPRYDSAVAEGLVERIGEEIDKRIDARIGGPQPPPRAPRSATSVRPHPGPVYQAPASYPSQEPFVYHGPAAAAPVMPAAAPPAPRRASGLSGAILGLGSMGLGVGATAVVVSHHVESVAALLMVALIWVMIAVINIAHAQRRQ